MAYDPTAAHGFGFGSTDQDPAGNAPAEATKHGFTFEIWPSPMPAATYPMLVPGRTGTIRAASASEARKIARAAAKPGTAIGACTHNRSVCGCR